MSKDQVYTDTVELIPTEPDCYSVHVPALPGVVSEGGTVEEALAMAREAIALHLEGLREDGPEIPIEPTARRRDALCGSPYKSPPDSLGSAQPQVSTRIVHGT